MVRLLPPADSKRTRLPITTSLPLTCAVSIGRTRRRSRSRAVARADRYSWRWRALLYSKFSRRSPCSRAVSMARRLAGISSSTSRRSSSRFSSMASGVA